MFVRAALASPKGVARLSVARTMCTVSAGPSPAKPKVMVLGGLTGTGKGRLALALARRLGGELILADSVKIYRGCVVGSNLPATTNKDIPVHLEEELDMSAPFSAGDYRDMARERIDNVLARGKVPIVVGGSNMYLRWLMYSSSEEQVKVSQQVRDKVRQSLPDFLQSWDRSLESIREVHGDSVVDQLNNVKNDEYRIQRILERLESKQHTGLRFSIPSLQQLPDLDYDFRAFFLGAPRHWLCRRLDMRCEKMIQVGLLPEVAGLIDQGLADTLVGRAVGYRQTADFLGWFLATMNHIDPADVVPRFYEYLDKYMAVSRLCAKKQMVGFSRESIYQRICLKPPEIPWTLTPSPQREVMLQSRIRQLGFSAVQNFKLPEGRRTSWDTERLIKHLNSHHHFNRSMVSRLNITEEMVRSAGNKVLKLWRMSPEEYIEQCSSPKHQAQQEEALRGMHGPPEMQFYLPQRIIFAMPDDVARFTSRTAKVLAHRNVKASDSAAEK